MRNHATGQLLIPLMAVLTAATAQVRFLLGPIPFTMQNTAVALAGLLLTPRQALASMLLYLLLIALGLPLASGFKGGLPVLFGFTAGYLWGFALSAPLISMLTRTYLRVRGLKRLWEAGWPDRLALVGLVTLGMAPTYLLGFLVFTHYAIPGTGLYQWASEASGYAGVEVGDTLMLLAASVLVFLPQDALMDHPLAVVLAATLSRKMWERGLIE